MAAQVDLRPAVMGNVRACQLDAFEFGRVRRAHAREHLDVAGAFAAQLRMLGGVADDRRGAPEGLRPERVLGMEVGGGQV
jgi:hypothetical protein